MNLQKIKTQLSNYEKTDYKIRGELYSGYDFYNAGPWIILDVMNDLYSLNEEIDMTVLERKIANRENICEDVKMKIIRDALYFDSDMFMSKVDRYCEK